MALAPLQGLGSLGMLEAIRRESFRENYAGNSHGKLAIFTSCVVRCSCCHCVVMPVAMMARTAASAMVEAMYIDARIMLLPRSRSGGIESACHQHSGWEWLTKPFKKLRWASRPNRLANLQGTDDQAPSRLTHCRRGQMKQSWPSFMSGSSTDQGGGKRQPITNN